MDKHYYNTISRNACNTYTTKHDNDNYSNNYKCPNCNNSYALERYNLN